MMNQLKSHTFVFWVIGIIFIVISVSCAPATRYEILSFFFDGVPHYEGSNGKGLGLKEFPQTEFQRTIAALPKPKPVIKPPSIVSVHKPVQEKKCRSCHDPEQSLDVLARDAQLCDKCHQKLRIEEGWNHGPINLGTCIPCHQSHDSMYQHLLISDVPDLCFICHREDWERESEYHKIDNNVICTECHDPHNVMY